MAPRWDKRLRLPKSEGGATICEKHEFIEAHFRDPEMSWEVDQAVTQAKDDGKRMEARLQELGEEANNLEDALSETEADRDRLRAELDRLRSAPVAVEVPEPTVQQWLHEVLDPAEADPDPHATMRHATRWFREHIRTIPSDRVLNDGEVAIRADVLSAMEGCIATLRADDELIPSKALAHLDALRSKGGE